jgi:hypothetical protein
MTSSFGSRLALLAVLLGGAAAIAWTSLGHWQLPAIGPRQADFNNALVRGFRKGGLALDIEVPEALRRSKDPMDVFKEANTTVVTPQDVSYFNGRFYLYFGAVPAVVLFWPFQVLTGHDLPLVLGSLVFGIGAFLVVAWLWLRVVADHFPRAGLATRLGGFACLGLAGGQWVLARRVSIWEPSISAGNFFLMGMLACGYRALNSRRPWGWLAASGLSLGLATGSRPTLAVAGVGFLVLAASVVLAGGSLKSARDRLMPALAACIPLAAVAAGLLAYNWARFGDPFELGLKYQLSTWNERHVAHFALSNIPYNFYLYFLSPPQWGRYFPFVHPIAFMGQPAGYYGYEYVYGALLLCPVLWWMVFVPILAPRASSSLRVLVTALVATALATTFVILCFDTAAARYETDFLPWWVFLGLLGWCLVEDRARASVGRAAPRALAAGFAATAGFSCILAFCCSADLHGILKFENPEAFTRISRAFNTPTAMWERLAGFRGGAVTMDIAFARRPGSSFEPLVVTGVEYQKDFVYVYYQSDTVVRFCYSHPGEPVASSADVTVEPGRKYPLRVECGSLFPPRGHAAFDGWLPAEVDSFKRWVRIDFNGKTVLVDTRGCNEASPGTLRIGEDPGGIYGLRFAGSITNVERAGCVRPEGDLASAGDLGIVLALPSEPLSNNQPIVSAGTRGAADILALRMNGPASLTYVYESPRVGLWQSGPVAVPPDRLLSLRVRLGPLLGVDGGSPLGILARSVVIWQDGAPVWWHHTASPLAANPPLELMANTVGSSAVEGRFLGKFVSARRIPVALAWRSGPFGALEMRLGGRGSGSEPLLATGRTGKSDTLAIGWLADGKARLLYDHWNQAIRVSDAFAWPEGGLHSMRIEIPSLPSLDASAGGEVSEGPLKVSVDGKVAWEARVPFYAAASGTVAVGVNASGCSTAGADLTCAVVDLVQVARQ